MRANLLGFLTAVSLLLGCGGEGEQGARQNTRADQGQGADVRGAPEAADPEVQRPPAETVDVAYISEDFQQATIVRPQRLVASPVWETGILRHLIDDHFGSTHLEEDYGTIDFEQKYGLELSRVESVTSLTGMEATARAEDPKTRGMVIRLSAPVDRELLKSFPAFFGHTEATRGEVGYWKAPNVRSPHVWFADDKTLVLGRGPVLFRMIAARDTQSPLVELLKRTDANHDMLAVTAIEPQRGWRKPEMPYAIMYAAIAPVVDTGWSVWNLDVGDRPALRAQYRCKDVAVAEKVKQAVESSKRDLASAPEVLRETWLEDAPPEVDVEAIVSLVERILSSATVAREGSIVVASASAPEDFAARWKEVAAGVRALANPRKRYTPPAIDATTHRSVTANRDARLAANKLRQIMFALAIYHDTFNANPPAVVYGPDGKPWHSWRVLLLPFLDREELFYDRYKMDEPWDGPNNRRLLAEMPDVYRSPFADADSHDTWIVTAVGERTALTRDAQFDPRNGGFIRSRTTAGSVIDGLAFTAIFGLAPEGSKIPWTKPEDLAFSDDFPGLGQPKGFAAPFQWEGVRFGLLAMADTTIISVPAEGSSQWIGKALTRNGDDPYEFPQFPSGESLKIPSSEDARPSAR